MANVVVEYREPGEEIWHRVIAAPGETYEECVETLKKRWPTIETRLMPPPEIGLENRA